MKKRLLRVFLFVGLLSGVSTRGWGQAAPSDSVGNPLKERQAAFAGLAAGRIPTGVLLDRTLLLTNPHRFAGQGDTAVKYSGFEQQYWEFYHAALDTTRLPTLAALRASIAQRVQQDVVPLLMLQYTYNELSATAASNHLITIDSTNERVYDGPDMSSSPYTTGQLFSVVLPVTATSSTLSLYVGPEFWLGNTAAPSSVQLDFGDGWGGRTVAMGSTIQIQVTAATAFSASPQPALGATGPAITSVPPPSLASGGTLRVTNPSNGFGGVTTLGTTAVASISPDVALGVLASQSWPGFTPTRGVHGPNGRATAIAWIKYAASNTTGKLRRPLVFVEGIDFEASRGGNDGSGGGTFVNYGVDHTGPIDLASFTSGSIAQRGGFRNGSAGWNEMVDYNSNYKSLEQFPALRAQLQASTSQSFPNGAGGGDYDLVYLDFSDGATLIQQNAMTFVELLQWINQPANRTPDAEETLVIAASMGGQVARFGLAWMEQQGLCHNSKLYVSFDSPHRGANVPLGIQYMFDRLQSVWIGNYSAQVVVHDKLLREAAMQMSLFHFADMATPYRTQWQAWQASPGSYPSLLRKVAIANGSGRAVPQAGMFPGMRMLHTSGRGLFTGPNYAFALPGTADRGHNNVVFRYRTAISLFNRWHYSYADPNWSYYDTCPGSSETTAKDANDASSTLVADWNTNTFMSTVSALDVQDAGSFNKPDFTYNIQQQIPFKNLPNRAKYAFDAYFTADNVNEPHVQITNGQGSPNGNTSYTTDNGDWIQNELRESAHHLPAVLTTIYNYGSPYRHLLASVQVNAGGQLYLNNGTLPASGGTPATQTIPAQGNFDMYTSNCATVVQVNDGGQMLIGTTSTYPATLLMAANSLLDLHTGGRVDVNVGSVLRIPAGATLVVRSGSTLNVYGQVLVEAGAYVCVENSASIVTAGGTYTVSPAANYSANPALGLSGLACAPSPAPPLSVSITSLVYGNGYGSCVSPSGQNNYATWTAAASGGTGVYQYDWYLYDNGTGTYQPTGASGPTYGLCLNGYTTYAQVQVVATSGTQQATDSYYAQPMSQAMLYPNPANAYVDVASNPGPSPAPAHAHATLQAATFAHAAPAPVLMQVTVYNGQARVVFSAADVATPSLRVNTQTWPAGLYQVRIQRGPTITQRQLSVQH